METPTENFPQRTFSIKLWPPSQSTRMMLVERITKNLSTETIFSRRYGILDEGKAKRTAEKIEEECFNVANNHFKDEPDGDGSAAVQLYAKETSKRMLEALKQGPQSNERGYAAPAHEERTMNTSETVFDISGGSRSFIDDKEAEELFKPLTMEGNSYRKICLSNRSFGIGAANVVGPILASLKGQLTDIDLSDFIAGRDEEEALNVMRVFSSALSGSVLRSLNLSHNALGEKGVRAFAELLESQNSLEELYLLNDGISEEAAKAVCELVPSTEKLKVLHFHNNMTGDEGALAISEILKRSPLLEDFRCSSTRVGSEGGVALAKALGTCTGIKRLDLRDNMFGVDAGKALAGTLRKASDLTEVYLSYLNLEKEGAIEIANALKDSSPSLEVFEMAGNDITTEAAPALATFISAKGALKKMSLAENELKDEGAVKIAEALQEGHEKLKELDMSYNMMQRVGARSLARVVVSKLEFEMLNINGNAISDEGIDEVKDILKAGGKPLEVLGPLDENDPEGEFEDGEEADEENDEATLESKLDDLKVEQD